MPGNCSSSHALSRWEREYRPGHFAVDGGILDDFPNRRPLVAVSFGEQVKIRRVGSVGVVKAPGDDKILEPG